MQRQDRPKQHPARIPAHPDQRHTAPAAPPPGLPPYSPTAWRT